MHIEILNENQKNLLSLVALFKREFYLVGGTAIALQIGHRQSIDFDLFKEKKLRKPDFFQKIKSLKKDYTIGYQDFDQLNLVINDVKFTFFQFPYSIPINSELKGIIKMPDLLTLGAMKAFDLGKRAKWKDYVDLYFLLKYHFSFQEISDKTKELFGTEFVEKQFAAQLGFFDGINYDEEVVFLIKNPPTEKEIKDFLVETSISDLPKFKKYFDNLCRSGNN